MQITCIIELTTTLTHLEEQGSCKRASDFGGGVVNFERLYLIKIITVMTTIVAIIRVATLAVETAMIVFLFVSGSGWMYILLQYVHKW